MAHKRMFSKDITGSDAFREMPPSSQALYFHLGMEADDDGFLDNYRGLMRGVNASEDDLKILITKRFLILFPSKVVVVKHWLINNTIRKDRYSETKHLDEKRALVIKENGAYTDSGIPPGNQVATQKRIEEDRRVAAKAEALTLEDITSTPDWLPPKRAVKTTPEMRAVFAVFDDNPERKVWHMREVEREAAAVLHDEFGVPELMLRYAVVKKHKNDPRCPSISKPSDFLSKMPNMEKFLQIIHSV